jgi:hypothetical protein
VFDVDLLIVFLAMISLEFLAERFLATYAIETFIKKWYIPWVILNKWMVHPMGYP